MFRIICLVTALAFTLSAKQSRDLKRPKAGETATVIVQYRSAPGQGKHDKVSRKGGRLRQKLDFINASSYEVNAEALDDLLADDDVEFVSPNRTVSATVDETAQGSANFWPVIEFLNNNWQSGYHKGTGFATAVIDSGVAPHRNFNVWDETRSRIVYAQSFVENSITDNYGHGIHVAGIIASSDLTAKASYMSVPNFRGFWGPALDSNIVSLKVLDKDGKGTDLAVINAIDRAIQLKSTYNIRVMNLSLGRPIYESYKTDPLCRAVERAWKAGIFVVVAAGNYGRENVNGSKGYGTITAPGNSPWVLTVGAVNQKDDGWNGNDNVASYSSKGPTFIDRIVKPDLVVPGNQIYSLQAPAAKLTTTYPGNRPLNNWVYPTGDTQPNAAYLRLSGTSMAAPLASAAAILMIAKEPALTPDQIKFRMMKTAWRGFAKTASVYDASTSAWYTVNHDIFTVGAGMLDMTAAFWNTEKPTAAANSPRAYYDTATKKVRLQFNSTGTNVLWGDNTPFPANVLWGENASGSNVLWGENVVWGTSTLNGFNVVWGTSSTWSQGVSGMGAMSVLGKGE